MGYDVELIRSKYPALTEGYVHFDSAGGTQMAQPVADAVHRTLRSAVSNRTDAFAPGRRSGEIVAAARDAVADLVGGVPEGVVFGSSATTLTYQVARALAKTWRPGDELVVSRLDHDANVRPWLQAAEQAGVTVRWAEFDRDTGELPAGQYESLVGNRTRLVAVTAASNAIGTRPDLPAIAALAHDAGALVYVDGVHATPHGPCDLDAYAADFYVTSAYKWSGPHLAAVVAAPAVWEPLHPDKLAPSPDEVPDRFEAGTSSFELLAGVTAAVDHLAALDPDATGTRRERLIQSLRSAEAYTMGLFSGFEEELRTLPGVTVYGRAERRAPTVSFRIDGQLPAETATALGEQGLCLFSGDYYAYEYFTALGLRDTGGAVRASLYHYTTAAEVERLLAALRQLTG